VYIAGTEGERTYMRALASIYKSDCIVDSVTAAASLIEGSVITELEVQ
jgi:hypothetical protein